MTASEGRIPPDKIDEVRLAADIVEIVGSRVRLTKKGKDFWGLCPFHGDTDPSFKVDRERGTWYCFGCQEGGSVFNFLMKDQGLSFPEAVRAVAARYGVRLPSPELSPQQRRAEKEKETLQGILETAAEFFVRQLNSPAGESARGYLFSRRKLDADTVRLFGLGWAPSGWENLKRHLLARKVPEEMAIKAGLLVPKEGGGSFDRFRGRLIFPIKDPGGRIISFGGRLLTEGEPKYLNGPESPLFNKSQTLYNLDQARPAMRKKDRALLVEGYFDVITLCAHGFGETVAPMGTALTAWQARRLRSQADDLVVIFDGDEAGLKAAHRALSVFLSEGVAARVLLVPAGEDPDSWVGTHGKEVLEEALAQARPLTEMVLDRLMQAGDLSSPEGRSAAVGRCGPVLKAIKDPVTRFGYLGHVAAALQLDPEAIRARLGLPTAGRTTWQSTSTHRQNVTSHLKEERSLLELALANPPAARVLAEGGALDDLSDPKLGVISRAIKEVLGQGGEASSSAVSAALEDQTLAGLVVELSDGGPQLTPEKAVAHAEYLLRPKRRQLKRELAAMKLKISQAQADGDKQKVTRLQAQRKQIYKTGVSFHAGKE